MTLKIELAPEKEKVLAAEAARRGIPVLNYAKKLLEESLPAPAFATPEERAKAFREWAEGHSRDTPLLSEEAVSRASIYGDRD